MSSILAVRSVTTNSPVMTDNERVPQAELLSDMDKSVGTLAEKLAELDQNFSCFPVSRRAPVVVEPGRVKIGDDNLILTDEGWCQLAKQCGASSTYWAQFAPDFRAEIAQYHFDHDQAFSPMHLHEGIEAIAIQNRFLGFRQS